MKTAVIYARYSSDSQTEQSIEGQMRVCEDYARNNDIVILARYIDRAMTGTNDNRPDFQRMLKDSDSRTWNYVLVYKLDRFSRNKYEMAVHKKTLKDNGVRVISATEYIPDSPEAIILESMLEGYAEYYSAELSQKVRRGMNESRRKGNFTGGVLIYGYRVQNKKVIIQAEEAEVVRYIYGEYARGVYVKDIIADLTAKGIMKNGKPFATNTIYNILKNEKYSGIYRHDGEVFDNIYPQIVSTEIFDQVRTKTEANRYGKRSTETVYLLRNKLKCGYCSSPISAETGTAKVGVVMRYYKCLGKKHGNGCCKAQVRKDHLEKLVLDNIIGCLSDKSQMDIIVDSVLKIQDERFTDNQLLKVLTKELKKTETSLENIMNAIENGGTAATAMKRLQALEKRQEDLTKQIAIEQANTTQKLSEKDVRQFYRQALEYEPVMLLNYLVESITLYDDRMEIKYKTPLKKSPDDSRGFSLPEPFSQIYSVQQKE